MKMNIPFSPPAISEESIDSVIDTLRSGWITTGPKVADFEKRLSTYMGTDETICMNSATAALESALRILGIGYGDEVITTAYTYTASASVIDHVGAKIVLVDTEEDSLEMDYEQLESLITPRTKAIIPVDIAGVLCDYEKIYEIVLRKRRMFKSDNFLHQLLGRVAIILDGAHSFGATRNNKKSGMFTDFTAFSFHAVKNLTTAEGGALTWNLPINKDLIKQKLHTLNLHGQTKDAKAKMELGNWEYDIEVLGFKNNLTDIAAAIGIEQLNEYNDNLKRRHEIIQRYEDKLDKRFIRTLDHKRPNEYSSGHLFLTWIDHIDEETRNKIITEMAKVGVATNVHYKPLPMFTAYKNYGFNINDYKNAYNHYKNEITLPLYPQLIDEEVDYIIEHFNKIVREYSVKKKVLILGIAPVQAEAIEKLKSMGMEVHAMAKDSIGPGKDVADVFAEIDFSNQDEVLKYMTDNKIDVIYSVGSDVAMPIVASVSEALYLPHFVTSETAILCNKKDKMRRLTKDTKGHVPFQVVDNTDIDLEIDYPVFVKPTDSQGQRGITLVNEEMELKEAIIHAIENSKNNTAIIEKYIGGYEISVNGYAVNGEIEFLIISDRVTWKDYEGLIQKHVLDFTHQYPKRKIEAVVQDHLKTLNITDGPFYAQMKVEENTPYMIEITPRLDGCHMHKVINHATDVDLLDKTFKHLLFSELPEFKYQKKHNVTLEFQCHAPNERIDYNDFDELQDTLEHYRYYNTGDLVKPVNGVYDKVGYYIYRKEGELFGRHHWGNGITREILKRRVRETEDSL